MQIILKHVNIANLWEGDIVKLEHGNSYPVMNDGAPFDAPFQDMLIEKITGNEVYFNRPYAFMSHVDNSIINGEERFTAYIPHRGLYYQVYREVETHQEYKDRIWADKYNANRNK